ncbi:AMP-binding protein [Nocardiopsis sp. ATB16-24]|uniref:AMP-binding protein n=1 Tax=Nocardiopsis sp. ATB16-24 TaxID=3019555 RepID=UPI0025556D09|nr:AMP-binding protein [Nocardiopsis sp. ATB16-24]
MHVVGGGSGGWSLRSDRILEARDEEPAASTGPGFGVYRALKSPRLIGECVSLLDRGGVAALVPASAADGYFDQVVRQVAHFAESRDTAGDTAAGGILALPTSGSTGSPKLVAIPAEGIVRFMEWGKRYFGFDASTVSLSLSPWNFDVSLLDTWAVLAAGGTVVAADAARLQDTDYLRRLVFEHRPTFLQTVPSTLDALVKAIAEDDVQESVTGLVLTGGVAAQVTRGAAARRFPSAVFYNVYGATEVNDCSIQELSAREFAEADTLPLGEPITGCDIVLGLPEGGHVPVDHAGDAEGEVLVRTPWMALGYLMDGALHPLPAVEVEGHRTLYPMKDRVSCTAGRLTYLGRRDRTVKIRGQRIDLDEIEQAARRTGLAGMACAWIGEEGSDAELHLAYTTAEHAPRPASGLQVRMQLSRLLPSFAMPNRLHLFDRPFPLNGNGKPDLPMIKKQTEGK